MIIIIMWLLDRRFSNPLYTHQPIQNCKEFCKQIHGFIWEVEYIKYTDELTNAVNKYNDNLESIAQRILNLKIEFNDKDIEVRNLYGLLNKLSVVNSVKSRKETEQLLENVITEYGYMLEVFRDTGKLPQIRNSIENI